MSKFKPTKTRILKKETILNDGTHIYEYEAQVKNKIPNGVYILLCIPIIGWWFVILYFAYIHEWYDTLGDFKFKTDAMEKIQEFLKEEKQIWLKQKLRTEKKYIKYP